MSETSKVKWSDILTLLSPGGQQGLVDFIRQAQADRGKNWLPEIQAEYPMFTWIVELVCKHDAEDAFIALQREFPGYPLSWVKSGIHNLHGVLRTEIERKREWKD